MEDTQKRIETTGSLYEFNAERQPHVLMCHLFLYFYSTDGLVIVECSKLAEIHEEFSNEEVKALLKKYVST